MNSVSTAEPEQLYLPRSDERARQGAAKALSAYEAAEPSRHRRFYHRRGSQNEAVQRSGTALRTQIRHLARNHDLARGALRTLVNNVAGASGVGVEPQPRAQDGGIHKEFAEQIRQLWQDWSVHPEVTHQFTLPRLQRAVCRSWLRDGECFAQMLSGRVPLLDHGTRVPFSLELFEADLVPLDYHDDVRRIAQGIERNAWGRPVALHAYTREPWKISTPSTLDRRRISWERVLHIASLDHIGQMRGVSEFASIITRLEDIKDYEESERVAAKIAARLTAYIKKGDSASFTPPGDDPVKREIDFQAGTVIDDLAPGEEVGLIDSSRPNTNLINFRQGQMRAAAAGIGASASSISNDYDGTYSARRQELVEQWVNYAVLTDEFAGMFLAPSYRRFLATSIVAGELEVPEDVDVNTLNDCMFVAQAMPWIDPLKEALGWQSLAQNGFASETEIIRKRGRDPKDVLDEVQRFRKESEDRGLYFISNAAAEQMMQLALQSETD